MNEMELLVVRINGTEIPPNWHTAAECRARAESWENAELKGCVDSVLASLWTVAEKGGVKATVTVKTGRPEHFYKTFRKVMESLGYKVVDQPINPMSTSATAKEWTFSW